MKKIIAFIITFAIVFTFAACAQTEPAEEKPAESVGVTAAKSNLTFTFNGAEHTVQAYYPIEDNYVMEMVNKGYINFDIYDTKTVTADMLANRAEHHRIIVECVIGIVTNKEREGDGRILNTDDDYYNYISYRDTDLDYTTGTIMVTYLMYNPDTNYEDDIIERYDYVLDRNYED